jgi:hypothetical protein
VAGCAKGLPHLGTCLPVLPAFKSLLSHSDPVGRLYTAGSPRPARPHRPRGAASDVSRLHVLPHCSRPFHPLARSHPHSGYHSRHRGTCPTVHLDIRLRLPTDHHHRPGTPVRIPTVPVSGQAVWYTTLADHRPPPRGQRPRGALPPDIEGSYHVPCRPAMYGGPSPGAPRHARSFQRGSPGISGRARVRRAPKGPWQATASGRQPRVDLAHLISELRQHMPPLRPTPAARHASPATFVHGDLEKCTHVFLCQDAKHRALEPPITALPDPVKKGEDVVTPRTRETCHHVN